MDKLDDAKFFNLIVCFIVVILGFYWLRFFDRKWKDKHRFLYRAYACWWFSWLAWVISWILIRGSFFQSEVVQHALSLLFTDLNATFLILVYFNLTRGNQFRIIDALYLSGIIILAIALVFGLLHLYIRDFKYAAAIQIDVELCIGFVTTMLLGWAFALRYNTNVVLVVGYVYGFLQPISYRAVFHPEEFPRSPNLFITVIAVLGFMKIVWATVITWFFMQDPKTTESLVRQSSSSTRSWPFQGRMTAFEIQTLVLIGAFVLFLSLRMQDFTSKVIGGITQLLAVYGILMGAIKLKNQLTSKVNNQDGESKNGNK